MNSPDPRTDHLVFASPDLAGAVARMESLLGVVPTPGGNHPEFGTRNALVSLGPDCYLEIIGPDPGNPGLKGPRAFGIDELGEPALVTWMIKEPDLDRRFAVCRKKGYDPGELVHGRRQRPDGQILEWRLGLHSGFFSPKTAGVIPFLIDWGSSPHPSRTAVPGCRLISLRAEHPDPKSVQSILEALEVELPVSKGNRGLVATIDCPRGRVELTGEGADS